MNPISRLLYNAISLYELIVFISVVMSWFLANPYQPIVRFIYSITNPVFHRVRRALPFVCAGGIDFSPLIVILALELLRGFLARPIFI